MLCLNTTTKTLEAITLLTPSTALDVVVSYVDITSTTTTMGESDTTFDQTATTILAAPAGSTARQVKHIAIYNRSNGEQNVTVSYNNNGTKRKLISLNIEANGALFYTNEGQWFVGHDYSLTNEVLTLSGVSAEPSAPGAGTLKMYSKSVGGRMMAKQIGPSGLDTILQPAIFGNGIQVLSPGSGTAFSAMGMAAPTAVGTVSHPTPTATNQRTQTRRGIITSAGTANSASEIRNTTLQCYRGDAVGLGGFYHVNRFAVSSTTLLQRVAVGLFSVTTAIATTQSPSSLTNCIIVGWDSADTTLQIMHNDAAGSCTKIDLGANFPANEPTAVYESTFFAVPNTSTVAYRVLRLDTGSLAEGTISTDLPAAATFLAWHAYMNNGGTLAAVVLEVMRMYMETDY